MPSNIWKPPEYFTWKKMRLTFVVSAWLLLLLKATESCKNSVECGLGSCCIKISDTVSECQWRHPGCQCLETSSHITQINQSPQETSSSSAQHFDLSNKRHQGGNVNTELTDTSHGKRFFENNTQDTFQYIDSETEKTGSNRQSNSNTNYHQDDVQFRQHAGNQQEPGTNLSEPRFTDANRFKDSFQNVQRQNSSSSSNTPDSDLYFEAYSNDSKYVKPGYYGSGPRPAQSGNDGLYQEQNTKTDGARDSHAHGIQSGYDQEYGSSKDSRGPADHAKRFDDEEKQSVWYNSDKIKDSKNYWKTSDQEDQYNVQDSAGYKSHSQDNLEASDEFGLNARKDYKVSTKKISLATGKKETPGSLNTFDDRRRNEERKNKGRPRKNAEEQWKPNRDRPGSDSVYEDNTELQTPENSRFVFEPTEQVFQNTFDTRRRNKNRGNKNRPDKNAEEPSKSNRNRPRPNFGQTDNEDFQVAEDSKLGVRPTAQVFQNTFDSKRLKTNPRDKNRSEINAGGQTISEFTQEDITESQTAEDSTFEIQKTSWNTSGARRRNKNRRHKDKPEENSETEPDTGIDSDTYQINPPTELYSGDRRPAAWKTTERPFRPQQPNRVQETSTKDKDSATNDQFDQYEELDSFGKGQDKAFRRKGGKGCRTNGYNYNCQKVNPWISADSEKGDSDYKEISDGLKEDLEEWRKKGAKPKRRQHYEKSWQSSRNVRYRQQGDWKLGVWIPNPNVKPGFCPRFESKVYRSGKYRQVCNDDTHCPYSQKCCCKLCVDPIFD